MGHVVASEGNLVVVDFGRTDEPLLSKKSLAVRLGFSPRWVELRMKEGMPSSLDRRGRRMFRLQDVQDWLAGQKKGAAHG